MSSKFDVKGCSRSLSKLMAAADVAITRPGGALHTQRLIDYCSNEFQSMTEEQCLAVLQSIDKNYKAKVLTDGHGGILGYLYSRKVFVFMGKEQQRAQQQSKHSFDFASAFVNNNKKRQSKSKAVSKSAKKASTTSGTKARGKARAKAKKK